MSSHVTHNYEKATKEKQCEQDGLEGFKASARGKYGDSWQLPISRREVEIQFSCESRAKTKRGGAVSASQSRVLPRWREYRILNETHEGN